MVVRLSCPKDISGIVFYNERKVRKGDAELIHEENFLKDKEDLSSRDKIDRFRNLIDLQYRTRSAGLHVSLNFAEGEDISCEKLIRIGNEYMEAIGFVDQPYLIYNHKDAAHPHIHIVSTIIKPDGKPIRMHGLCRDKSQPARKALEIKYNLIKTKDRIITKSSRILMSPERATYGRMGTKETITNTLNYVLHKYKYRSFAELNAILRLYNLFAHRGKSGSRISQNRGLVYKILDDQGKPIGVPIRASEISFRPTLDYLENRFKMYQALDPSIYDRVATVVDIALRANFTAWEAFSGRLRQQQIECMPLTAKGGYLYGLVYVDIQNKIAIDASYLSISIASPQIFNKPDERRQITMHDFDPDDYNRAIEVLNRPVQQAERIPKEKIYRSQKISNNH